MSKHQLKSYRHLSWDSEFFGFPIGMLEISDKKDFQNALAIARSDGIRLLYWKIPQTSCMASWAKDNVSGFVGDQITFQKPISAAQVPTMPQTYRYQLFEKQTPECEMYELSCQAGEFSRYKIDPRFSDSEFHRLYEAWINNSCSKSIADAVLLIRNSENDLAGLLTVATKDHRADIGLLSVSPAFRRQGIGSTLIGMAESFASENQCTLLQVVTQVANVGAVQLYGRAGFIVANTHSLFHLWLDAE